MDPLHLSLSKLNRVIIYYSLCIHINDGLVEFLLT